tara:strand:+ start:1465 stop:1758 length:294 start_codon:yes stop_codon:yes gene_type:complete
MKYYLVQGKETDEPADDAFTFHYQSDRALTFKEIETLAVEEYCSDEGIEKAKDGKFYFPQWDPDVPATEQEVDICIWEIYQSDSPITLFTQTNKEQN